MLLPGVPFGVEWLMVPLFAAASVVLWPMVLRRTEPDPGVRLAATLLFAFTPFTLFLSGSYMNHVTVLTWILLALAALARVTEEGEALRPGWAFVGGLGFGVGATVRPLDAFAFAPAVWDWLDRLAVASEAALQVWADTVEHLVLHPLPWDPPPANQLPRSGDQRRIVRGHMHPVAARNQGSEQERPRAFDVSGPGERQVVGLEVGPLHQADDARLGQLEDVLGRSMQVGLEADAQAVVPLVELSEDAQGRVHVLVVLHVDHHQGPGAGRVQDPGEIVLGQVLG